MAPRFGTDGIRGHAGTDLTTTIVRALGAAAVDALGADLPYLVARDTRESGLDFEIALIAGIEAAGGTARSLGVLPTPGLAGACAESGAPGAMISASHNPFFDNGVKLFEPGGRKLRDATETAIEAALAARLESFGSTPVGGDAPPIAADAVTNYVARLVAAAGGGTPFSELTVVVDCAHGAAFEAAPAALRALGARVEVLNAAPDGRNINDGCGSTHPAGLAREVVARGADVGLAFDGDADRVLAIDAHGALVDGDHILAILAVDLDAQGRLRHRAIATTVMANLGLTRALAAHGIDLVVTPVGDRHVLAAMEDHDLVLGGEQSGHVIASEHAMTGDGPLTGILVLDAMARSGRPLHELAAVVTKFPQVLENVRVADRDALETATGFWDAVRRAEGALGEDGRVVVRPSGTEPVVRVMVEAVDSDTAARIATELTAALHSALG